MTEDEKILHVYLFSTGWHKSGSNYVHADHGVHTPSGAKDIQLRCDAGRTIYLLENLKSVNPDGAKRVIGGYITMLVLDEIESMLKEPGTLEQLNVVIVKAFSYPEFRQAIGALRAAWDALGSIAESEPKRPYKGE